MLRILRAFAWMRWRVLRELARAHRRARHARAPVAGGRANRADHRARPAGAVGASSWRGWAATPATGSPAAKPVMTFEALRILLLAACGFAVVGPMLMPSMEPTAVVRLLLLPIPRGTLYAAQAAGALSEPWVLIALPGRPGPPRRARGRRRGARGGALPRRGRALHPLPHRPLDAVATLLLHLVVARPPSRRAAGAGLHRPGSCWSRSCRGSCSSSPDRPARERGSAGGTTPMPAWVTRGGECGAGGRSVRALRARDAILGTARSQRRDRAAARAR